MANNNALTDLENYRKFATATHVFKNTSGASRFFAYIGPNGKELANNETHIVEERSSDFNGVLAKQALSRDLASGAVKFGNKGVTLYHVRFNGAGTAQTIPIPMAGRCVGVFCVTEAGADGTEAVTATVASTSVVAASQTVTANSASSDKAKALNLSATDDNLNIVPGTLSVSMSNMTSGDIITVVVAIAHFV
jgi:hypothetical protein